MPEINLLQGEKRKTFHIGLPSQASGSGLIWVLVGILALDLAIYGVFFFLSSQTLSETNTVNAEIAAADFKMQKPAAEFTDAIKAQSALKFLSGFLDNHIYWTKLWDRLGENTFRSIQYLSLSATTDNTRFVLAGTAQNYADLGKLILGLQAASDFQDVQLVSSGGSKGETAAGIDFSIAVQFNPGLLRDTLRKAQLP